MKVYIVKSYDKRKGSLNTWKVFGYPPTNKACLELWLECIDMSQEDSQKKCFHYTNTQPLWEKDNLSKGNKIL